MGKNEKGAPNQDKRPIARDYFLEQQLCRAIRERKAVRFLYDNEQTYRILNPYIVYKEAQGRVLVGGVRVYDESEIFKPAAPRRYEVGRIARLELTDEHFSIDHRFSSDRDEFSNEMICAIDRH